MNLDAKFKKLKETIKLMPNKKPNIYPSFITFDNHFEIISALYQDGITFRNVSKIDDIYESIKQEKIDPSIFNNPYYVRVILNSFDEEIINIINIINQFDDSTFIEIDIANYDNENDFQTISKITHPNCNFNISGFIDIESLYNLATKYSVSSESTPNIVVDNIDDNTVEKIKYICKIINDPSFRIMVNDIESLYNYYNYESELPDNKILLVLGDYIFNQNKNLGARDLILEDYKGLELKNKNITIIYQHLEYDDINQIFELERNLELIRSHIPSRASELDIVTYLSLFIINYFKYDDDLKERIYSEMQGKDINLLQFVSKGEGVCRHFASFTKCFLNSLGIECEKINGVNHSFNVVKIDGKMYFLDNTWLTCRMQNKEIKTLSESSDFLRSNISFGHDEYSTMLQEYNCEEYDRNKIDESVSRVMSWRKNYQIHIQALKDLLRKYGIRNKNSISDRIVAAIPRRR